MRVKSLAQGNNSVFDAGRVEFLIPVSQHVLLHFVYCRWT